jgi:hypothetical protein
MDPKTPIFTTLSYRYALASGTSYGAELFAIIVWSWCGAQCGARAIARGCGALAAARNRSCWHA